MVKIAVLTVLTLAGAAISIPPSSCIEPLWPRSLGYPPDDSLSPCASGCNNAAAANSACFIPWNKIFLCADATFRDKLISCLQSECSAPEMNTALILLLSQCVAVSRSVAASPTTTNIPPSSEPSRSPAASLAMFTVSSIDTFRPPTPSLAVITGPSTTATKQPPSSSPSAMSPSLVIILTTVPLLPPSSVDISHTSAADTVPSTTADAPATNRGCASIHGMGIRVALASMVLGGFMALYG
ncbi:hypothetical protein DFH09DRAFT_1312798 [Mycena vulgaris]|nr:hypothetical protein DFH09DRAFT_1312798 [Mycena vulgaris]